jgi:hypothetical protein
MIALPLSNELESLSKACVNNLLTVFKEVGVPINKVIDFTLETDAGIEINNLYLLQVSPWDAQTPYALYLLPASPDNDPIQLFNNIDQLLSFLMET